MGLTTTQMTKVNFTFLYYYKKKKKKKKKKKNHYTNMDRAFIVLVIYIQSEG